MSVLPQLERDLFEAAERRLGTSGDGSLGANARDVSGRSNSEPPRTCVSGHSDSEPPRARVSAGGLSLRRLARRLRVPAIALGCLLAATTIALAASGVILTGTPVRPEEVLNPDVGEGVPAPGASLLLPLRIPDPEGGLPWGMRIVHTTRGEICMQIGRVQNGQLGELGIDGAFHDDGRFHPLPADALPADEFHGRVFSQWLANATTTCGLTGEASVDNHVGVERSAAANANTANSPLRDLRDIYAGILGPQAVSVSYRAGKRALSMAVVPRIGAYLIVRRAAAGQPMGSGGASIGTEGDLAPSAPLTTITYRLDGKLCRRGPSLAPGETAHLASPCPWPRYRHSRVPTRDLHQPPQVRLQIAGNAIAGVEVHFTAPFAVTSAHQQYTVAIPSTTCKATGSLGNGMVLESLAQDVPRGALLTARLGYPFENSCGRRSATIEVFYQRAGEPRVLVGSTVVHAPAGLRLAPPGFGAHLRRRHRDS
jgi:hypothetical protein